MTLGAIVLLLGALACVAVELFLPTHGVLAICGAFLALGSVIMAARASAGLGVLFGLVVVIGAPIVFYWAIRLYPDTPMGKRVMLKTGPGERKEAFADERARLESFVGKHGVAMTPLRPAGNVELEGERVACQSEAGVIEAGTMVEVIRVAGMRVIVKAV